MLTTLIAAAGLAVQPSPPPPPAIPATRVDPLTVAIELDDVERFERIWRRAAGRPSAAELQRDYLAPGSPGIGVFMDGRIQSAEHLAKAIAADPAPYAAALDTCLPLVRAANADLRAIYLGLTGLVPDRPLPRIYVVIGAGNSGGTAAPGAQVLGLEVLCRIAKGDRAVFRANLRHFFAHETVHALQREVRPARGMSPLLTDVLTEGAADFVANLVTGEQADPARAAWAAPREADLWRQFETDLAATVGFDPETAKRDDPRIARLRRWVGNYQSAPTGWFSEAGYWIGQRIWERWYAAQPDKHAAIAAMLDGTVAPRDVLAAGRYR